MRHLKTYKIFEKKVPKVERDDIYRDGKYILVSPLTHSASCKEGYRDNLEIDESDRVPMFIWEDFVDKLESLLWNFGTVVKLDFYEDFHKSHKKVFTGKAGVDFEIDGKYFYFKLSNQGDVNRVDFGINDPLGNLNEDIDEIKRNFAESSKIASKNISFKNDDEK